MCVVVSVCVCARMHCLLEADVLCGCGLYVCIYVYACVNCSLEADVRGC